MTVAQLRGDAFELWEWIISSPSWYNDVTPRAMNPIVHIINAFPGSSPSSVTPLHAKRRYAGECGYLLADYIGSLICRFRHPKRPVSSSRSPLSPIPHCFYRFFVSSTFLSSSLLPLAPTLSFPYTLNYLIHSFDLPPRESSTGFFALPVGDANMAVTYRY